MSEGHAELRDKLARYMLDHSLKKTRQRDLIFDCFVKQGGHMSVDDLLARVQTQNAGVGYATVYRTLKLFVDAGIAHERRFIESQAKYEQVELGDAHHDHLICRDCGHIFEFDDDLIERRQSEIAAEYGLRITGHRHVVYGSCVEPDTCVHRKA
jgi:Fur family ferric uptake transcriptional regulator